MLCLRKMYDILYVSLQDIISTITVIQNCLLKDFTNDLFRKIAVKLILKTEDYSFWYGGYRDSKLNFNDNIIILLNIIYLHDLIIYYSILKWWKIIYLEINWRKCREINFSRQFIVLYCKHTYKFPKRGTSYQVNYP